LRNLETLDLTVHVDYDDWGLAMVSLRQLHHSAPLKTLKIDCFDEPHNSGDVDSVTTVLSDFLYAHRVTLRVVELTGYLGGEE